MIIYGEVVWWPKVNKKTFLSLSNLPLQLLDLVIKGEAKLSVYRLGIINNWNTIGNMKQRNNVRGKLYHNKYGIRLHDTPNYLQQTLPDQQQLELDKQMPRDLVWDINPNKARKQALATLDTKVLFKTHFKHN